MNYNTTIVGEPYVRVHRLIINWPDSALHQLPTATLEQSLAVKLASGAIRTLEPVPTIEVAINMEDDGNTPIPLVDFETGELLGVDTTLNQVMLGVLAVIRSRQIVTQG